MKVKFLEPKLTLNKKNLHAWNTQWCECISAAFHVSFGHVKWNFLSLQGTV